MLDRLRVLVLQTSTTQMRFQEQGLQPSQRGVDECSGVNKLMLSQELLGKADLTWMDYLLR